MEQNTIDMGSTSKDAVGPIRNNRLTQRLNCVNRLCTDGNKLVPVVRMVCLYYSVTYKPHKRVCTACFIKCTRHYKNLEMKMRDGKCIMDGHFPNYDSHILIDSSDDESERPEPTASNEFLSLNKNVKAELDYMLHHVTEQNKDLIEQQNKVCHNYLKKQVEALEERADGIDSMLLELYTSYNNIKNILYVPFRPTIVELNPVDLDELEEEEANKTVKEKANETVKEEANAIEMADEIDSMILEICITFNDIMNMLYDQCSLTIVELNPVDLDELEEEEANTIVKEKANAIERAHEIDSMILEICITFNDIMNMLYDQCSLSIVELNPVVLDELEEEVNTIEREDEIDSMILEICITFNDIMNMLYDQCSLSIVELNPVDLDELEEKINKIVKKKANETVKEVNKTVKDKVNKTEIEKVNNTEIENNTNNKNITVEEDDTMDKEDVIAVNTTVCIVPADLPKEGPLEYPPLQEGQFIYAMKKSFIHRWDKVKLDAVINIDYVLITFGYDQKLLTRQQIAFYTPNSVQFPVGSRVIAKVTDSDCKVGDHFYAGIIAEPPKLINQFRYMIFFDNGYVQYRHHKDIRLIVYKSNEVWNEVYPVSKSFILSYLFNYPDRQMVRLTKNHFVRVEHNNQWESAKVLEVDASMVKLFFKDLNKSEWLYRGSSRFWNIHHKHSKSEKGIRIRESGLAYLSKQCVEYTRIEEEPTASKSTIKPTSSDETTKTHINSNTVTLTLPRTIPQPREYVKHLCNVSCVDWTRYNYNKTAKISMLATPLHFGFNRYLAYFNDNQKCVLYETPCGYTIRNIKEMHDYLISTKSTMTIDQFDFSSWVNPLSEYEGLKKSIKFILDFSVGKEFRAITCVNSINNELPPPIEYMTVRQAKPGVKINLDSNSLCGCDCTDNCQDKSKCACWKMTIEGQKIFPNLYKDPNIGYDYRRLPERVITGIYECNRLCKCSNLCLNRVVQQPLTQNLQMFFTKNKGWGVRCLNDIPQGSFICVYVGNLLTETDANERGINYGDEYFAELDYIEGIEKVKEDFESDVLLSAQEDQESNKNVNGCVTSELSNEDYQTAEGRNIVSDMSLRLRKRKTPKNHTKTKKNGKHAHIPIKVNTRNMKNNSEPPKSMRKYYGDNESVYIMDAKITGNIGRYLNHSCCPNTFVQNVFVDTYDLRFPWISFFALHYIQAGTELTWDYNYEVGSVPGKELKCLCKSNNCKGRLL